MRESVTVSLPPWLKEKLDQAVQKEHANRSDIVREALRQYFDEQEFKRLRAEMIPAAQARGIFTEDDVFREVS